jgi:hypothetical protein
MPLLSWVLELTLKITRTGDVFSEKAVKELTKYINSPKLLTLVLTVGGFPL